MLYMKPKWKQTWQNVIRNSLKATHRCTLKNFLFSRDHQRKSSQGWTKDYRRNQVKFEQSQRTKRGQKSMIWHRGSYFPCKRRVKKTLMWKKACNLHGRQITSSYCGLPKQGLIIYWCGDRVGQGPYLAHAPKPNGKCCRRSYCQAKFPDFVRRWSAESRKACYQFPSPAHL